GRRDLVHRGLRRSQGFDIEVVRTAGDETRGPQVVQFFQNCLALVAVRGLARRKHGGRLGCDGAVGGVVADTAAQDQALQQGRGRADGEDYGVVVFGLDLADVLPDRQVLQAVNRKGRYDVLGREVFAVAPLSGAQRDFKGRALVVPL